MNMKYLRVSLAAVAAFSLGTAVADETRDVTYTFTLDNIFLSEWANPFSPSEEPSGFRLDGVDGFSFTAFGASPYHWENTTAVFGFAASPNNSYNIDWANSWLESRTGRIRLADFNPLNTHDEGVDWLAAHPQGGNGLNPETAWYVTLPVDAFAITGGQLAYTVTATTVPEPGTVAMLLLGLGLVGTVTRRRARG